MLSSPGTDPGTTGTEGSEIVFTQHNGLMNCREFRRKHDAYIDDTLSGVELERVARHRSLCVTCARLDTRVRRSLLIARNLPIIQPSPAFHERLQTRLAAERISIQVARTSREQLVDRRRPFGVGAYAAIAAGVLAVAGLASAASLAEPRRDVIRLSPVVTSRPEPVPALMTTPAMVASMPVAVPLWPAVFVAQQAPYHFASDAMNGDYLAH